MVNKEVQENNMLSSRLDRVDIYSLALFFGNLFIYSNLLPTLKFVVFRFAPQPTPVTTWFFGLYGLLLFLFFYNLQRFITIYNEKDVVERAKMVTPIFLSTSIIILINTFIEILVSRTG